MLDTGPLSASDTVTVLGRLKKRLAGEFSYNDYPLWARAIDRVVARVDGSRDRRTALDKEVARILREDEPFVSMRRTMEEDRRLFDDAMRYVEHLNHSYWEVKRLGDIGIAEPVAGCPKCKDAYDTWISLPRRNALIVDPVDEASDKLSKVHDDYMAELRASKVIPMIMVGQGLVEEEEEG